MTFNGTSAAYLVAFAIAAARAAFSSADSLGNANASITSVNAAVSSSTNASNSSLSCCAVTAQLLKYSSLSSQPRFPADRFATIPPNEAPSAPINAATEPPPGAGESLRVSLQNSRRFIFARDLLGSADSILNSITFSFGSKGFSSLKPIERMAMSINSSSDTPSDHFCLRKKYRPASTRLFFGDRKSTRLNSSHSQISYAVFCLKKKKKQNLIISDTFNQSNSNNKTNRQE